jgi:glycosyltransferase involved in cell wall biosynthesis
MMDRESMVSVIMPCYNSEANIKASINSVLDQDYYNWELIVIDDCSSDNTIDVIKSFNDNRIKCHSLAENSGSPAAPRNKGLELAKGDYIAFLDSDDLWAKNKLKLQIEFMKSNSYEFTCTAYSVKDKNGVSFDYIPPEFVSYYDLLYNNSIGCLTAVVKKNLFENESFPLMGHEDFALWLKIIKKVDGVYSLKKSLAIYNKLDGSVSSSKIKLFGFFWKIFRRSEGFGVVRSLYCCSRYFFNVVFLKYR